MTIYSIIPDILSLNYPLNTHYIHYNSKRFEYQKPIKPTLGEVSKSHINIDKTDNETVLYEIVSNKEKTLFKYQKLRKRNNFMSKVLEVNNFRGNKKLESIQILSKNKLFIIRKANGNILSTQEFNTSTGMAQVIKYINGEKLEQNFQITNGNRKFSKGVRGKFEKASINAETIYLRILGKVSKIFKYIR